MKIGIITFQETNNYGAILQNYALQHSLKKYGHDVETIDYRSRYISKPYKLLHLKKKGIARYLFGVMGYICYLPRQKRNSVFRQKINYSKPVKYEELVELNQDYDMFITGSDQVWNVNLTGHDDTYFLGFVAEKNKKNSYAASVGLSALSEQDKVWYNNKLSDFTDVLVRETSSVALLEPLLNKSVKDVVDPVFLLDEEEWKSVMNPVNMGDYILVYQLGISKAFVKYAVSCAKKYNCKLIFVPFPLVGFAKGKYKFTAGAGDVLSYIAHAKYIITDSFHGTALSIIFNKKFTTLVSGTHSGVSSRLKDMLKKFGLENRIWIEGFDLDATIDYKAVNRIVKVERQKALELLKKITG